jgi:hypothetical protein
MFLVIAIQHITAAQALRSVLTSFCAVLGLRHISAAPKRRLAAYVKRNLRTVIFLTFSFDLKVLLVSI